MSVYMTEEEQLETMKKWWQRYGNIVTICLSVVLFCIAGYRYIQWHQYKVTQQASITYEKMMLEFSNQNNKAVWAYANELIKEHNNTVYADVAHLTLAKLFVAKNKLEKAKDELKMVEEKGSIASLKQVAKIRIARILAAKKSYSSALSELSSIDDKSYMPVINELKGDIYGATGQYKEAINAYKLAIDEVKNKGIGNLFLEMKTSEVANKSQSMRIEDKKVEAA
jgi:predicted negative regulator of RcsB-dependent stress response